MAKTRPRQTARGKGTEKPVDSSAGRAANDGYRPPLTISRPEMLEAGSDNRFRQLIYDIFVTGARLRSCRERFGEEIGVTGPQYTILIATAHRQGESGVSIGALADYMHVAPSFTSVEVTKLIRRGFLEKRGNPEDGRSVLVSLSKRGEEALADLNPLQREINDTIFEGLSHKEFLALSQVLARLVINTENAEARIAEIDRARDQRRRLRAAD